MLGKLDLPNVIRPAARPGVAFVGDAALASDPLWGVGCGWAFQSARVARATRPADGARPAAATSTRRSSATAASTAGAWARTTS